MESLFTDFTWNDFCTFALIATALFGAFKGYVSNRDWVKGQYRKKIEEEEYVNQLKKQYDEIQSKLEILVEQVAILMGSDKEDFKAYLLEKHAYYMKLGYIDSKTLEIITNKYEYYKMEKGNSYGEKLFNDIKSLPIK